MRQSGQSRRSRLSAATYKRCEAWAGHLDTGNEGNESRPRPFSFNVRAVLPFMRGSRKGHIINVSSISERVANPGSAYYAATKFAREGLSQGLAKEVEPLGIRVRVIELGPLRTDFRGGSMQSSRQPIADCEEIVGQRHAHLRATHGRQEGDPARVASVIFNAVMEPAAPLQLVLGQRAYDMAEAGLRLQRGELETQRERARSIDFDAR